MGIARARFLPDTTGSPTRGRSTYDAPGAALLMSRLESFRWRHYAVLRSPPLHSAFKQTWTCMSICWYHNAASPCPPLREFACGGRRRWRRRRRWAWYPRAGRSSGRGAQCEVAAHTKRYGAPRRCVHAYSHFRPLSQSEARSSARARARARACACACACACSWSHLHTHRHERLFGE